MSSIVKKLKVMPTSQILLDDYRGEISLKDKDVSNMLTKRMHKKYKISDATIQKIINRDREIFDRRGDESSFYAFDSQHGLYDTLDILYDYIQPTDPERWFFVTQRFLDLTFSELAVASRLFLNLGAVHSLNGIHLEKTAGDLEQERNEKALGEYYEYLNKSARTFYVLTLIVILLLFNHLFQILLRLVKFLFMNLKIIFLKMHFYIKNFLILRKMKMLIIEKCS